MPIRIRITLAALVAALIITVTLTLASVFALNAAERRFSDVSVSGKRVLLEQLVARHVSEMTAFTKALTRDSVTLKALRKGDLKTLQEQLATTHNLFKTDGTLDRIQILDPAGRYLAAAPAGFQGETRKTLVRSAAQDGKVVQGLSMDDDGALQAVLAFPLYARGKLKGVAVYARDLQRIIDDFQRSDESDVFVVDGEGRELLRGAGNGMDHPPHVGRIAENGSLEVQRLGGRYVAVSTVPLRNRSGGIIGHLAVAKDQHDTYQVQTTASYTSVGVVLLTFVAAALGLYWYIRRAFRPIDAVVRSIGSIAAGDLSQTVAVSTRNDETGRLAGALTSMMEQLRALVADITASAERLTAAGDDLRRITVDSSAIIAKQSEETDQVATAVNEMATTVQQVAGNAAEAADAATLASNEAVDGQAVVQQTVESIGQLARDIEQAGKVIARLSAESENIGSVLDVIHSISEQTNLLALNAAIEAARAGDQGRGFAVVADEVRTLASRTQASTEEIQQMISRLQAGAKEAVAVIDSSQSNSAATVEYATRAGDALSAITESARRSNEMNGHIAQAAGEQRTVADMINDSVAHISQLAESARRHTDEIDRASRTVAGLSESLGGLIHRFKL